MTKALQPVSTRIIAKKAGVSHVTVSLALRNHPSIPAATAARIQALAQDMGYRPNPLVHALMAHLRSGKLGTPSAAIAFVTSFSTRDGWRRHSSIFAQYFEGAEERARRLGYRLEEIWAKEPGMTGRRLSQVLLARGIRGLLIGPLPAAHGHLSLDWSKFAAVTMGHSVRRPTLHRVTTDHYGNARLVLRQLKRLGYQRIGLCLPRDTESRTNHATEAAFLAYQLTLPAARRIKPLLFKDPLEGTFRQWFRQAKPDVVIGQGRDRIREWISKCGCRVPDDVGYATVQRAGDDDICSGIDIHADKIGVVAINLINALLQQNEVGISDHPNTIVLGGKWVDATTLRPNKRRQR